MAGRADLNPLTRGSRRSDNAGSRSRRSRSGAAPLGRSGPRSRLGCVTCKQRRVRCDEAHPVCGHCTRLQLHCQYKPLSQKWSGREQEDTIQSQAQSSDQHLGDVGPAGALPLSNGDVTVGQSRSNQAVSHRLEEVPHSRQYQSQHQSLHDRSSGQFSASALGIPGFQTPTGIYSRSGNATPNQLGNGMPSWTLARTFDFNDIFSELDTSWAGELSCILPDAASAGITSEPGIPQRLPQGQGELLSSSATGAASGNCSIDAPQTLFDPPHQVIGPPEKNEGRGDWSGQPQREESQELPSPDNSTVHSTERSKSDPSHLFHLFKKIHQPPAAILIGGFERWHRLQHYLCKLSDQSRAVNNSLLCVIQLLLIEDMARDQGQSREACMTSILERHHLACQELGRKLAKKSPPKAKARECLLATIFLLGWFEVIRDQDSQSSLFPRQHADTVITSKGPWNRYSQQLLSWLNTLDSKATHLGREHLLAPTSLQVVSYYHTEIASSLHQNGGVSGDWHEKDGDDSSLSPSGDMESSRDSHASPMDLMDTSPSLNLGQVKQAMLNTILQPALAWYLTSQSYCRRISAHDKHHRRRFNSDDEYEVVTACKQIETELFELWDYRPAVISVPADQLMAVVSPDVATRLEEIFSTYLASFWILFVYLHRISWWHLPLSPLAHRALSQVWRHLRRAYGEEVNGPLRRVIHPSLLWPLFLFGSECQNEEQRTWAIEQLEALGEAKPVLASEGTDTDTLPPFKLSSGATRNAHRAALLLRELIKEQDARKCRVDDRDLSMEMFGCYFSIV